jgi:hypothetical protein
LLNVPAAEFIVFALFWLAGLLVTWLIIFSAVLAALRRHDQTRVTARQP